MQMKKQPPAQLETLNDLLQHAECYAESSMLSDRGAVPLSFMVLSPEGVFMHATNKSDTPHQKNFFKTAATVAAVAYKAIAVAVIAESWVAEEDNCESSDLRKSPNSKEVVMIIGQSRRAIITRFLFINRDSSGKFTGFGPSTLPDMDGAISGRFSHLMPARETTEEDSLAAFRMLQSVGIKIQRPGSAPQLN
jgi:hypothetical protein